MKLRKPSADQDDFLRARLVEMIVMCHELVGLTFLIDWDMAKMRDQRPEMVFVDQGYCGQGVQNIKILINGAPRSITRSIATILRRRGSIKPVLGYVKNDGRLM